MWKGLVVLYLVDFKVKVSFRGKGRCNFYHQASPRSLHPRPRTQRNTPTDCLKDHPAILSHTSKRNKYIAFASTGGHLRAPWHCRLLQTTTARHATHCTALVLCKWGERWLLCQTINWNLECSLRCARALKSLRSHHRLLLNFSTEAADTQTVERHFYKRNF